MTAKRQAAEVAADATMEGTKAPHDRNNKEDEERPTTTTPATVSTMAAVKVYVPLFVAFFSGFMQLTVAQDKPSATAHVIDPKATDQAIAYMLMLAALFVTYFAH
ncbi:hypothetical protein PR202_gb05680 [Eleusine coracana subsp. coracana]|uniref:Uncharacterized protein n=1 Tax=Eleusine coracana subsp. coracana TaxID=191504 RepID=A0AAV5E6V9_ELECO|nr:hypothetical protein PR202_gb05680 [Eleusine coracana subsp. coracana]